MDHNILFYPLNRWRFFIFFLLDKQSKRYFSSLWTWFWHIVYGKKGPSCCNHNSITKNIFGLLNFNKIELFSFCQYLIKFNNMFNVDTSSSWLILMNYRKFIAFKLPWNVTNYLFNLNWTNFNGIISP